ncbi:DUF2065 family protein [Rubellimicrobium arenae]|uniref:DUF2065 family protein n=1 Tax=Rubellimicrobium arenae TaxID=2817372 RepID=UPI001B301756|nr:DUF2065 family protein [Rubellimicrobium arenae]
MAWALLGVGLTLVVEGLFWVLAPGLLERMQEVLRTLSHDERRLAGLAAVALGLALVWCGRLVGGFPS